MARRNRDYLVMNDEIVENLKKYGKTGDIVFFRGGIYTLLEDGDVPTVGYRRWVQIPKLQELGVEF